MKQLLFILWVCITPVNFLIAQEKQIGKSTTTTIQNSDITFMEKAAESGMAEVMLGKLGQNQGNSQSIKDYGMMMEKDHAKANQELTAMAKQQNIILPTAIPAKMQNDYDALQKINGSDFDKAFINQMIADHQKVIQLFEMQVKNGKNQEVKSWAERTLPTLKQHLQHAQKVKNSLK